MKPHRVLIADDEPPARRKLRALLEPVPDFELARECADGPEAVACLREESFDLALLDVRMPGLDGLEVVREVGPERLPPVVFVTAHDDHAVRAFELHALDYLLKPYDAERFAAMLARARREIVERRRGDLARRLEGLLAERARVEEAEPLLLRCSGRTVVLDPLEIDWVEAADNYLRVYAAGAEHLARGTLLGLQQLLEPQGFLRIHRSLLVNSRRVRLIRPLRSGEVELVLREGAVLTSGRRYRRAILARFRGGAGAGP